MRIFPVTPSIESLPQNIVRYFRYFRDGQSISIDRIVIHRKCAIVEMESRKNDRPSSRPSLSLSIRATTTKTIRRIDIRRRRPVTVIRIRRMEIRSPSPSLSVDWNRWRRKNVSWWRRWRRRKRRMKKGDDPHAETGKPVVIRPPAYNARDSSNWYPINRNWRGRLRTLSWLECLGSRFCWLPEAQLEAAIVQWYRLRYILSNASRPIACILITLPH